MKGVNPPIPKNMLAKRTSVFGPCDYISLYLYAYLYDHEKKQIGCRLRGQSESCTIMSPNAAPAWRAHICRYDGTPVLYPIPGIQCKVPGIHICIWHTGDTLTVGVLDTVANLECTRSTFLELLQIVIGLAL